MNLNQREKFLGLLTVAVILLLVLDSYVLTPFLASLDTLQAQTTELEKDLKHRKLMAERVNVFLKRLKEARDNGLNNGAEAQESAVLHALKTWAGKANITVLSVRPEKVKTKAKEEFAQLPIAMAGTGTLKSLTEFLEQSEKSGLPLKINDLSIGSRKDGTDDLLFNLHFSALCRSEEATKKEDKNEK